MGQPSAQVTAPTCRNGPPLAGSSTPVATFLRSYRVDFIAPSRLATDASGITYVTDPGWGEIVVRGSDGEVLGWARRFGNPVSVAVDAKRSVVLVGDGSAGRVSVHDQALRRLGDLGAGRGEFGFPNDIAVDPASGRVFVTDSARHELRIFDPPATSGGAYVPFRTIGGKGSAAGQFQRPTGIAFDAANGEVLVIDQLNYRIQAFDPDGNFRFCIGSQVTNCSFCSPTGGTARTLGQANGLAVDQAGRLYVADAFQGQVRVFDRNGALLGSIGRFGEQPGSLRNPTGVSIDANRRLFVAAGGNARIEMFGLDAYSDPERVAPAVVIAVPDTLDRTRLPATLGLHVEIPGYPLAQVAAASITANGRAPISVGSGDPDFDGVPDLVLAVDAAAIAADIGAADSGVVSVTGQVGAMRFSGRAVVTLTGTLDSDGDGVPDSADRCPATEPGSPVDAGGCAMAQLCPCGGPPARGAWANHGEYVACVATAASEFQAAGLIGAAERGSTVAAAAQSECGHRRRLGLAAPQLLARWHAPPLGEGAARAAGPHREMRR